MKKILLLLLLLANISWSVNLLFRSDLLTATRSVLDEPTAGYWSDNQLYQYINDAGNWLINAQLVTIEKFDTIITANGTWLYNLNADFFQAKAVFRQADVQITPLQQLKPEQSYSIIVETGDTLNVYYMLFGNDSLAMATPKIIFRPTPEDVDTYFVWYNAKAKFLSATDTVSNIPQPFRTTIPYLAAWFALTQADRDASKIERILEPVIGRLPEKKTELLPSSK